MAHIDCRRMSTDDIMRIIGLAPPLTQQQPPAKPVPKPVSFDRAEIQALYRSVTDPGSEEFKQRLSDNLDRDLRRVAQFQKFAQNDEQRRIAVALFAPQDADDAKDLVLRFDYESKKIAERKNGAQAEYYSFYCAFNP